MISKKMLRQNYNISEEMLHLTAFPKKIFNKVIWIKYVYTSYNTKKNDAPAKKNMVSKYFMFIF